MQRYKDWAPGPGDIKGKGIFHLDDPYMYNEWLVAPLIRTRDCGHLSQSNWDHVIKVLEGSDDEDHDDYEVLSWNHWACGWFEMIVVKQGTRAHVLMNKVETSLESYPALDEDDWMRREHDEHHDVVHEHCDWLVQRLWDNDDATDRLVKYSGVPFGDVKDWDLSEDFDPMTIASALNWHYAEGVPSDDDVIDALLNHDFITFVLRGEQND